jgi:hypothetical protein
MTQNKDPRNNPGTEDPSDAFLDGLTERAAADSQANLTAGGRVIESVFDDPIVKAELEQADQPHHPLPDRYKGLRQQILARNAALLRQQGMDDNAYWARPAKAQRHLILKHQYSCAQDAHIALEVAFDTKVIYIDVEHDPGRVPVTQIAQFVVHGGLDLGGEEAFYDDTVKGSVESFSHRTPWRIVVRSGDAMFLLTITRQLEKNWDYNLQMVPRE